MTRIATKPTLQPELFVYSFPVRVYFENTDAGAVVYHGEYLKFLERARTEFMRGLGFGKDYIFTRDLMFVVRDVALTYHLPARLDDELQATAGLARMRGVALEFRQSVRRGQELLAQGGVTVACVARSNLRPQRLPPVQRRVSWVATRWFCRGRAR